MPTFKEKVKSVSLIFACVFRPLRLPLVLSSSYLFISVKLWNGPLFWWYDVNWVFFGNFVLTSSGYANGVIGSGMFSRSSIWHYFYGPNDNNRDPKWTLVRDIYGTWPFWLGFNDDVCVKVLSRIYGAQQLKQNNYSRTLSSLAFAGTIVGMLSFGQSNLFLRFRRN